MIWGVGIEGLRFCWGVQSGVINLLLTEMVPKLFFSSIAYKSLLLNFFTVAPGVGEIVDLLGTAMS